MKWTQHLIPFKSNKWNQFLTFKTKISLYRSIILQPDIVHITHTPNQKRGSVHHSKVRFFVLHSLQPIYIDMCVCVCVCVCLCVCVCVRERIKNRKKENRDRRSANGISSPFSIKILVLKNQCPYSVDYGFLEHSYTHCQLVECVYMCVCVCVCVWVSVASVTSHFANSLLCHVTLSAETQRCVLANREPHKYQLLWRSSRSINLMSKSATVMHSASKFTTETKFFCST